MDAANPTQAGKRYAKKKKDLSMDALIYKCARNYHAPICTTNISDFKQLNVASAQVPVARTVPIYSPEEIIQSLTGDVTFDDEEPGFNRR